MGLWVSPWVDHVARRWADTCSAALGRYHLPSLHRPGDRCCAAEGAGRA